MKMARSKALPVIPIPNSRFIAALLLVNLSSNFLANRINIPRNRIGLPYIIAISS